MILVFPKVSAQKIQIMRIRNRITTLAAALALSAMNFIVASATLGNDDIDPQNFTTRIDNPFFPLQPRSTILHRTWTETSGISARTGWNSIKREES
jgi:hypothetical protein